MIIARLLHWIAHNYLLLIMIVFLLAVLSCGRKGLYQTIPGRHYVEVKKDTILFDYYPYLVESNRPYLFQHRWISTFNEFVITDFNRTLYVFRRGEVWPDQKYRIERVKRRELKEFTR